MSTAIPPPRPTALLEAFDTLILFARLGVIALVWIVLLLSASLGSRILLVIGLIGYFVWCDLCEKVARKKES